MEKDETNIKEGAPSASEKAQELAKHLWKIAEGLRYNMNLYKFAGYILGTLCYRFLSERAEKCIAETFSAEGLTYCEAFECVDTAEKARDVSIQKLGYIIEPAQLFSALVDAVRKEYPAKLGPIFDLAPKQASGTVFSVGRYKDALEAMEASTIGQASEKAFAGIFDDIDLDDDALGKDENERGKTIGSLLDKISEIDIEIDESGFDVLGTAYMILIGLFAKGAGKNDGEVYTPQGFSELLARLATLGLSTVRSACDCCAGSGSLLLEVKKHCKEKKVSHYYGQEKNGATFNLMRKNLIMHGINGNTFTAFNDDTIERDNFSGLLFHVQVANPPYSAKYSADKKFENDPRFSGCGVLAPKQYADLMFLEHIAFHMDDDGRAAVLLPHGVLFRAKSEGVIRRYLIEKVNVIDAIIGLPMRCFMNTSIPVCCIVLKRERGENAGNVWFCDASQYYTKNRTHNEITNEDVDRIVEAYKTRATIEKFSRPVNLSELDENGFNCNITRYVNALDNDEDIDINEVQTELRKVKEEKRASVEAINLMMKELGLDEIG